MVLAFYHLAHRVCLTGFDHFVAAAEQLKAVLLVAVIHISHLDVLQRNNALGFFVLRTQYVLIETM
jgi:hypothetical protein